MTEPRDRTLTPRHRSQRNPKPASGWLDTHREKQLRDGLRDLPELVATAATAVRGERLGGTSSTRSVPGSRPPLNLDALALTGFTDLPHPTTWAIRDGGIVWTTHRHEVQADSELPGSPLSVLAAWVRFADGEMWDGGHDHQPPEDKPTVSSECAWLLRHIVWILDQQWVDELALDVALMVRECRAILRERPTYRPRCQRQGCGGRLRDEGSVWRCDTCLQAAGDGRLTLRQVVAQQEPMTVGQLVRAFGLSRDAVNGWIKRGRLEPVDDARPARYDVLDALRIADDLGAAMD